MRSVKLITLSALMFGALFLTSCKKDWTCTCTYTGPNGSHTITDTYKNTPKSDAKTACQVANANAHEGLGSNETGECKFGH